MENKSEFPALIVMPTNRVNGFVKIIPDAFRQHLALISGIRCREEALALEAPSYKQLLHLLEPYPKNAAVRYYLPVKNAKGTAKVCNFRFQFAETPQLYAVWGQCGKVVAGLSSAEARMLRFALFEDLEAKQVCFQSYTQSPNDAWVQLMLNFAHSIQLDELEWETSEIKFESCDVFCNF